MELRSVEELMDLLYACRGARPAPAGHGRTADAHEHALRTAALLRRRHPADKELQVAGLVQGIGRLLGPSPGTGPYDRAAGAVRPLLGERVARLVRAGAAGGADEDAAALRRAAEEALTDEGDAGVLEDWRTLLALVADRVSRLRAVE
ncbi:hypothetical protein ACLMNJ_28770 [Streptomyces seoulensis]